LDALNAEEQALAEQEMIDSLLTGKADARSILGLEHFRSTKAIDALNQTLTYYEGYGLRALSLIAPECIDEKRVLKGLEEENYGFVMAVGDVPTYTLNQTILEVLLKRLVQFKDSISRSHVLDAIRKLAMLEPLMSDALDTSYIEKIAALHGWQPPYHNSDVVYHFSIYDENPLENREEAVVLLRKQIEEIQRPEVVAARKNQKIDLIIKALHAKLDQNLWLKSDEIHLGGTHYYHSCWLKSTPEGIVIEKNHTTNQTAKITRETLVFKEDERLRNWLNNFDWRSLKAVYLPEIE